VKSGKVAGMSEEIATASCSWTSADECAMARERSVAGISDEIPPCDVHGPYPVTGGLE
jgi:hypothetical protein